MEQDDAIRALGALAQATRLGAFRLLVQAGPDGMAAGDVAAALSVPPATLSFHLKELSQAGLVVSRRDSRQVVYSVALPGVQALLRFLTQDCCQGHPDLCGLTLGDDEAGAWGTCAPVKAKAETS